MRCIISGCLRVFSFFMYTAVIRSGIASVFVLIAIEQLMRSNPDRRRFVFYIIIGTLFHYSSFFFLFLLLFDARIKQSTVIIVLFVSVALAIVLNYTSIPYNFISLFTSRQKTLQWFIRSDDATANLNGVIGILFLLVSMYATTRYNLFISTIERIGVEDSRFSCFPLNTDLLCNDVKMCSEFEDTPYVSRYCETVVAHKLSMMMVLFSPLMIFASPFTRLPYMVFIFIIITTINSGMTAQMHSMEGGFRPGLISLSWVALLVVAILWKLYFDLPYLKNGSSFFWEYLDVSFV